MIAKAWRCADQMATLSEHWSPTVCRIEQFMARVEATLWVGSPRTVRMPFSPQVL
jgi:hypothetical protein